MRALSCKFPALHKKVRGRKELFRLTASQIEGKGKQTPDGGNRCNPGFQAGGRSIHNSVFTRVTADVVSVCGRARMTKCTVLSHSGALNREEEQAASAKLS